MANEAINLAASLVPCAKSGCTTAPSWVNSVAAMISSSRLIRSALLSWSIIGSTKAKMLRARSARNGALSSNARGIPTKLPPSTIAVSNLVGIASLIAHADNQDPVCTEMDRRTEWRRLAHCAVTEEFVFDAHGLEDHRHRDAGHQVIEIQRAPDADAPRPCPLLAVGGGLKK